MLSVGGSKAWQAAQSLPVWNIWEPFLLLYYLHIANASNKNRPTFFEKQSYWLYDFHTDL